MNIKTLITLGFVAMMTLLLAIGGYSYYTMHQLDLGSRNLVQANAYSISLGQHMLQALDQLERQPLRDTTGTARLVAALRAEDHNVTEPGEQRLVDQLLARSGQLRQRQQLALAQANTAAGGTEEAWEGFSALRRLTYQMMDLNTAALTRKSEHAAHAAEAANRNLLLFVTLSVLLASLFVGSVPEAAVGPLRKLMDSIEHATDHDFSATIPVENRNEFGRVARAFNRMLVQLQEYRSSTMAELITERNRAASIVSGLDEGLMLLDETGRVILANPVACTLLNVPARRLLGQSAAAVAQENEVMRAVLLPLDEDAARRKQAVADAPLLRIAQQGEDAFYRLAVQELVAFNEVLDKMEFVGQIITLRNVSDYKKLDQVKSDFLATVSHELKTPLSSININARLLQDERLPAGERLRIPGHIRQETQRLQRMVAELLDVARLDAGTGIALDVRPTSLAEVVGYATATVQPQLDDKHLCLNLHLPAELPLVSADVEKTTWVLVNLLANAIRFSPSGGQLAVRATAAGPVVQLSVQDHGPGIAPEHHERIFQRFVQLPDKENFRGGSGLGLSIAREFIVAQGGRLWVESELGSGSTFCFTLPVA